MTAPEDPRAVAPSGDEDRSVARSTDASEREADQPSADEQSSLGEPAAQSAVVGHRHDGWQSVNVDRLSFYEALDRLATVRERLQEGINYEGEEGDAEDARALEAKVLAEADGLQLRAELHASRERAAVVEEPSAKAGEAQWANALEAAFLRRADTAELAAEAATVRKDGSADPWRRSVERELKEHQGVDQLADGALEQLQRWDVLDGSQADGERLLKLAAAAEKYAGTDGLEQFLERLSAVDHKFHSNQLAHFSAAVGDEAAAALKEKMQGRGVDVGPTAAIGSYFATLWDDVLSGQARANLETFRNVWVDKLADDLERLADAVDRGIASPREAAEQAVEAIRALPAAAIDAVRALPEMPDRWAAAWRRFEQADETGHASAIAAVFYDLEKGIAIDRAVGKVAGPVIDALVPDAPHIRVGAGEGTAPHARVAPDAPDRPEPASQALPATRAEEPEVRESQAQHGPGPEPADAANVSDGHLEGSKLSREERRAELGLTDSPDFLKRAQPAGEDLWTDDEMTRFAESRYFLSAAEGKPNVREYVRRFDEHGNLTANPERQFGDQYHGGGMAMRTPADGPSYAVRIGAPEPGKLPSQWAFRLFSGPDAKQQASAFARQLEARIEVEGTHGLRQEAGIVSQWEGGTTSRWTEIQVIEVAPRKGGTEGPRGIAYWQSTTAPQHDFAPTLQGAPREARTVLGGGSQILIDVDPDAASQLKIVETIPLPKSALEHEGTSPLPVLGLPPAAAPEPPAVTGTAGGVADRDPGPPAPGREAEADVKDGDPAPARQDGPPAPAPAADADADAKAGDPGPARQDGPPAPAPAADADADADAKAGDPPPVRQDGPPAPAPDADAKAGDPPPVRQDGPPAPAPDADAKAGDPPPVRQDGPPAPAPDADAKAGDPPPVRQDGPRTPTPAGYIEILTPKGLERTPYYEDPRPTAPAREADADAKAGDPGPARQYGPPAPAPTVDPDAHPDGDSDEPAGTPGAVGATPLGDSAAPGAGYDAGAVGSPGTGGSLDLPDAPANAVATGGDGGGALDLRDAAPAGGTPNAEAGAAPKPEFDPGESGLPDESAANEVAAAAGATVTAEPPPLPPPPADAEAVVTAEPPPLPPPPPADEAPAEREAGETAGGGSARDLNQDAAASPSVTGAPPPLPPQQSADEAAAREAREMAAERAAEAREARDMAAALAAAAAEAAAREAREKARETPEPAE